MGMAKIGYNAGIFCLLVSGACSHKVPAPEKPLPPVARKVAPAPAPEASEAPQVATKEEAPVGPQSLTITVQQVSDELGIPQARLEAQAKILARYLETKRLPGDLCTEDGERAEKLCELVEQIEDNPLAAQQRRHGGRRVPIRPQHFGAQQNMDFSRLVKSISRESVQKVLVWSPRMLATTACPRNLSAAAIRRLENGLPSPAVAHMMEKLYEHAAACLKPDDEGYEVTHLRQGLLRLKWGYRAKAKLSLEKAVLAQDSVDRPRVLFWVGRLQKDAAKRKVYWDRLVQEYPLSYHSLEVWKYRHQDPLRIFESRPTLSLSRHVDNEAVDNGMRWLEALYVLGYTEGGQRLARWINATYKDEIPPSTALYVSALKSSKGNPLNTITFLTRQVNENPSLLNRQTLRLLFPRPFFEVFDRHSPNTDTALILAVARQESGFNPYARSAANARGLLQLLPGTARLMSGQRRNDLYDSETNARLGIRYLSGLIEKFGTVELALAGYNAGPGRVDEWTSRFATDDSTLFIDLIPFKETRHYVANILRNNYWYERLYPTENAVSRSIASESKIQRSQLVARLVEAHAAAKADAHEESF